MRRLSTRSESFRPQADRKEAGLVGDDDDAVEV